MPTGKNDEKNPDFDAEYDFSKMNFGDDADSGASKKKTSAVASDDDVFAGFGGGSGSDHDNEDADEFGGDDSGFEFEDMPDPNKPTTLAGNVDDEFADIETERPAARTARPAQAPVVEEHGDDPFADDADEFDDADDVGGNAETMVGGDDPFGTADEEAFDEEVQEQEVDERPVAAKSEGGSARSPLMKFAFPIAAVLGVGLLGYSGYSFLSPMFSSAPAPQQQAKAPVQTSQDSFPTKLPGQASPAPSNQMPANPPSPSQFAPPPEPKAAAPVLAPPASVSANSQPQILQAPSQGQVAPAQTAPVINQPQLANGQAPNNAPPIVLPSGGLVQDAPRQTAIPSLIPEDDLVGGGGRGGIGVPKEASAAQSGGLQAFEAKFSSLQTEVEGLKRQIASLTDRVDSSSRSARGPVASPDAGMVAEPVKRLPDDIVPPLKPVVIEGVNLKGVSRGVAWVNTVSGVVEVKEGDSIPNSGNVVKIRSYGGDWIVVTTQGIVVR